MQATEAVAVLKQLYDACDSFAQRAALTNHHWDGLTPDLMMNSAAAIGAIEQVIAAQDETNVGTDYLWDLLRGAGIDISLHRGSSGEWGFTIRDLYAWHDPAATPDEALVAALYWLMYWAREGRNAQSRGMPVLFEAQTTAVMDATQYVKGGDHESRKR